jgi:tRNA (cytosine38-C5)-methyltransferase
LMCNDTYKVLEFYSGIGGMRYALEQYARESGNINRFQFVEAFDINEHANATYNHNFNHKPCKRAIEHISLSEYNRLANDDCIFTMSPPCQPYMRGGLQKDIMDNRAKSFVYLMEKILPHMDNKPKYIFIENVKNFENSQSRDLLVKTLLSLNYTFQEYLLSPTQLGIPNERLRYYLTAKLNDVQKLTEPPTICTEFPTLSWSHRISTQLGDYLIDTKDVDLFVPDEILIKNKGYRFDIVHAKSQRCSCFTKAYGSLSHVKGTGPLLTTEQLDANHIIDFQDANTLFPLKLRLFHPKEIANLMGFPQDFTFSKSLSTLQCHKLLGNSLNVTVVSYLMTHMLRSI